MALKRKITHKKGKRRTAYGGDLPATNQGQVAPQTLPGANQSAVKAPNAAPVANQTAVKAPNAAPATNQSAVKAANDYTSQKSVNTFLNAILNEDYDKVKEFLTKMPNINVQDKHGNGALHYVFYTKNPSAMLDLLLTYDSEYRGRRSYMYMDITNNDGVTPLLNAFLLQKYDEAKKLIDGGASVDRQDDKGLTMLMKVFFYNKDLVKYETIEKIVKAPGYANHLLEDNNGKFAVDYAMGFANTIIAKNSSMSEERKNELQKIVELLDRPTRYPNPWSMRDMERESSSRNRPVTKKKQSIYAKLYGGSNNYAAMNNFSNGPSKNLIEAVERRNLAEVKQFLADNSTDINQKDDRGMTALHHAVEQRDQNIVKELLAYSGEGKKLDIDAMNNYNRTALYDAFMYSNHAIIELLIKHGANINIQNKDGKTILMMLLTSTKPNMEMIKLAISLGSKLDVKDKKGETAIDYAKKQLTRTPNSSAMKNLVDSMGGQAGGYKKKRNITRRRVKK